jgi:methyl-accepting chemotaxis protein
MTARTAEVSDEADDTDRHANDVRDNAAGLDLAIEALRHTVIRAVRSATPEVDRRAHPRFAVDLSASLSMGGKDHRVRVTNLSDGGAALCGASGIQAGDQGSVSIDQVGLKLPCLVKGAEGDTLHVTFRLDAATAERFRGTAERLSRQAAA